MRISKNAASQYLLALTKQNVQVYLTLPTVKAALIAGSVAEGKADQFSDIDLMIYYDELPSEQALTLARQHNQGSERTGLLGDRDRGSFCEIYLIDGVQFQVAHTLVSFWEMEMATIIEQLDVTSPIQKAFSGILNCVPLFGDELINKWQAMISPYPEPFAEAMVKHYLQFFPVWSVSERVLTRDATVWFYQTLVQSAQNILGVLAGLNRVYYSTFQFKRMGLFIEQLTIQPKNLQSRIEALFHDEPEKVICNLKNIVQETVTLVNRYMPQIETTTIQQILEKEQKAWEFTDKYM